jgi:DNA-binding response OmpR family regulator
LTREGFDVARVATGREAIAAASAEPGLVLLDLGLPDMDGYDVCREIRAAHEMPIIVITARGDEVDRVIGLELGADDYLVKPFGFRELVARMRAVTRRCDRPVAPESATIVHGPLEVDARTHRVRMAGTEIQLTRKEFDLLLLLARDPGATCTRQHILDEVWDAHWYGPTKTLDVHIASLRKKLGDPDLIETVRGVGFRLRAC